MSIAEGYVLYDPETEMFLGTTYDPSYEQIWMFYWSNGPVTEREFEVTSSNGRTDELWAFLGGLSGEIMNRAVVVPFVYRPNNDIMEVSHIHSIPLAELEENPEKFWIYA